MSSCACKIEGGRLVDICALHMQFARDYASEELKAQKVGQQGAEAFLQAHAEFRSMVRSFQSKINHIEVMSRYTV